MRYLSVVMLSIVLLLSACESEEPVENTPPAITIPPEIPIKLSLDQNPLFYEWVFGEDAEDGFYQRACIEELDYEFTMMLAGPDTYHGLFQRVF